MSDQDSLTIRNINGDIRNVKTRLPWGKERKILKIIGEVASQIPGRLSEFDQTPGIALLEYLTTEAPEKISETLGIVLGTSIEEIDEQFDGDAVVEFAIPFLTLYVNKWSKRLEHAPIADVFGVSAPSIPFTPEGISQAPTTPIVTEEDG